jgi:hypothetical protein
VIETNIEKKKAIEDDERRGSPVTVRSRKSRDSGRMSRASSIPFDWMVQAGGTLDPKFADQGSGAEV